MHQIRLHAKKGEWVYMCLLVNKVMSIYVLHMSLCTKCRVHALICTSPHVDVFNSNVGVGNMDKIPTLTTPLRKILWVVLEKFLTEVLVCHTILGGTTY